jgi:hypothetical protein
MRLSFCKEKRKAPDKYQYLPSLGDCRQPQRYLPIPQKWPRGLLVALKCAQRRGLEIRIVQMPIAIPADQPCLRDARLIPAYTLMIARCAAAPSATRELEKRRARRAGMN